MVTRMICTSFVIGFKLLNQSSTLSRPALRVGMYIKVSMVANAKPPITVTAKGWPMLITYSASPRANGSMATIVVMEVMRIGLIREIPLMISARYLL